MNTWFKNHPRRCWTWKSPGDRVRNQIDFILMKKRYRNSITSCKSMPDADCSSDQIPAVVTMVVKLKKLKKSKKEPRLQLNILEEDEELKKKYIVCVKNKFDILDSLNTAEEKWQKMKESIHEAAKEHIPTTRKESPTPHIEIDTEGLPIMPDEVEHAMKKIHKGKAAGPDDITIELLLALKEVGIQEVTKLLNTIYDTGEIPEDFKKSVFIALPKKPGTTDCEQHRIISLMSHLTKVLLRVLMSRMRNEIRPEISDTHLTDAAHTGRPVEFNNDLLLATLEEDCAATLEELTQKFYSSPSTVHRQLQQLCSASKFGK
ncbi:uncharacterized protein LOC143227418 [Tachypleus tridentatus]|uniref:uncharacterized protein LOC143227418 n=1 Tax=Tachypleus tridentatus TaxID=6853 RepID=UPI003FD0E0C6